MANMATCFMIGRVTKDPETKVLESGVQMTSFSLAVNSKYKDKETVSFFRYVAFGKTAELCAKHLAKGRQVHLESTPKQNRFEVDGQSRESISFIVVTVTFLDSPERTEKPSEGPATAFSEGAEAYESEYEPPF